MLSEQHKVNITALSDPNLIRLEKNALIRLKVGQKHFNTKRHNIFAKYAKGRGIVHKGVCVPPTKNLSDLTGHKEK